MELEKYSKPIEEQSTKLATIFTLNVRDSKMGRLWIPVFDHRFPLRFPLKFAYLSKIREKDNISGNHYHNVKEEIIIPLDGKFEFGLEDVKTQEKEKISIGSEENKAIYIRTGVSHKIISKGDTGILLVLASNPSAPDDEIEYVIE
ncbi:MAG: WxcM-like domain-containing protein [Nanoarchaeota archaeon]|nr:WxcM-like domain-containing protein [Nanoarchaeota archaeon]